MKTRAAIHRQLYETEVAAWCKPYKPILNRDLSSERSSAYSENLSSDSSTVVTNINTKMPYANTFLPGL
jgi:hypothetical protein